ncbi:MAG: outer membrane protein assembly factor BamD [Acidobacteriota bacterium]|nr:outer membrane protein assembly factor BamD [Acidobacteriota bacterium]
MTRYLMVLIAAVGLLSSCGFRRHKYDNPITKNTSQPDKVLFDKAINDIEHSRFEVARITLNTMINTYDQSEFLAKAKLAIADSWYREGGAHGLAQAEAEYKDFILFYPTLEEAAESQEKICMIHYRQMEKSDRDMSQAIRAEDECRQLLVQFPNSKFVAETEQILRNIQEALGEGEYKVGSFYYKKGSNPAAANRLSRLVDQYPLYSKADEALFELGDAYERWDAKRFRKQSGDAFARIVRDYPLSDYADNAKKRLNQMELPVPEADPAAVQRMQYEIDNRHKPGMLSRSMGLLKRGPDVSLAAKAGKPAMETKGPTAPANVPTPAPAPGFTGDVTAGTVPDNTKSAIDTNPDARQNPPAPAAAATSDAAPAPVTANSGKTPDKPKKKKKAKAAPAADTTQAAPAAQTPPPPKP